MKRRRVFGLQGWLVGALLAVGMAASLAVLLVVLPTLESSVRGDRAKRDAQELARDIRAAGADSGLSGSPDRGQLQEFVTQVRAQTGAEVRIDIHGLFLNTSAQAPGRLELMARMPELGYNQTATFDDERAVATVAHLSIGGDPQGGTIAAAREVTGLAPELAIVRQRVIIAMIVVLGLAALAGIALARVLGGRIRRLASTAATLAAGDLSARAPTARVAPEELATLGDSLNGMAAQLQSMVSEITSERDRDRALIGSLAEGVIAVAPDGAVVVTNDAANRLLGFTAGESTRLDALPTPILDAVRAARADGAPPVDRRQVALPGGVELELHVARIAADDAAGGTVITLRDVTDERRLERARRDLVANVSHELKTPIAALKGFLELLEGQGVSEQHRREFLQSMSQETGRLERLVEEQLQLARLDAGALPLDRQECDLDDLAEVVTAPRVPLARREGITLAVTPSPAPVLAEVDPARIEQILLILLDNALRHTPSGGEVTVIVGRDGQDATIAVRDTGEGIPADAVPFVFDRFYRGDPSRAGRSAGLGLAIARGLAAAHRGGIELESRVGVGSTFTLRLPLLSAGPVTEESPIPDLSGITTPPPGAA